MLWGEDFTLRQQEICATKTWAILLIVSNILGSQTSLFDGLNWSFQFWVCHDEIRINSKVLVLGGVVPLEKIGNTSNFSFTTLYNGIYTTAPATRYTIFAVNRLCWNRFDGRVPLELQLQGTLFWPRLSDSFIEHGIVGSSVRSHPWWL